MALLSSILGIVALAAGLVIFVVVLAIIVDIVKWLRNPDENSGLPD